MKLKTILLIGLLILVTLTTNAKPVTGPGEETIHYAAVKLTSAEILASFTTAKVLVSAPNSDYLIVPISVTFRLNYGSATYSDASGTSVVTYAGQTSAVASGGTILAATATSYLSPPLTATTFASTVCRGKDLVLKHTTANPTTGNGTLTVYIAYRLIPVGY